MRGPHTDRALLGLGARGPSLKGGGTFPETPLLLLPSTTPPTAPGSRRRDLISQCLDSADSLGLSPGISGTSFALPSVHFQSYAPSNSNS